MKLCAAFVLLLALLTAGCDNNGPTYNLHAVSAVALSPLKSVCFGNYESYLMFIADEETDETRVKLISGCSESFISNFNDPFDGKTGIKIDGAIQAMTATLGSDERSVDLVVAATGVLRTDYQEDDHSSGAFLRIYHITDLSRIMPEDVKTIQTPMVLFLGDQNKTVTGLTHSEAFSLSQDHSTLNKDGDLDSVPIAYACGNEYCLILTKERTVFKHISGEALSSIDFGIPEKITGLFAINKKRWAVTTDSERVYLFNDALLPAGQIVLPDFVKPLSVSYLEVPYSFPFRLLPESQARKKVSLSINESNSSDDSDTEDINDDADEATNDDDSADEVLKDAEKDDIIAVTTYRGSVLLYDVTEQGWMVRNFTEADDLSAEEVARRNAMKPELYRYFRRFPGAEDTKDSAPKLAAVEAVRNLYFTVQYTAVFNGTSRLLTSRNGQFDADKSVFGDQTHSFTDYGIVPGQVGLLLLNRNSACSIDPTKTVSMDIESVLSPHLLKVSTPFAPNINECFGPRISYTLFPKDRYMITLVDPLFRTYEHIGDEFAVGDTSGWTYRDQLASFRINRVDDSKKTEVGFTVLATITPGVFYLGYQGGQQFDWSRQPVPGRLLLFSSTKRLIIEFDPLAQVVVNEYK